MASYKLHEDLLDNPRAFYSANFSGQPTSHTVVLRDVTDEGRCAVFEYACDVLRLYAVDVPTHQTAMGRGRLGLYDVVLGTSLPDVNAQAAQVRAENGVANTWPY